VGVATITPEDIMNTPTRIDQPLKKGDRVAYYIKRNISTGHHSTCSIQVRRTGIVQGWRDGKVVVLHKAGYTEDLAEADLYLVE
jgi:hypothetical protein